MNVKSRLLLAGAALVTLAAGTLLLLSATDTAGPAKPSLQAEHDALRRTALLQLAALINRYHAQQGALPLRLATLVDAGLLADLPLDPATGEGFDYEPEDAAGYALCARFDAAGGTTAAGSFTHSKGRSCLRLTADYGGF